MKIFVYDFIDEKGKKHFKTVDISEEEANEWVQRDYERRLSENVTISKRTPQEIQDDIDKEYINCDRREHYHKTTKLIKNFANEETSLIDLIPDETYNPYYNYIKTIEIKEIRKKIKNKLSKLTKKQKKRLLLRYVKNMTLKEIAVIENKDISSISESINTALKKINSPKRKK